MLIANERTRALPGKNRQIAAVGHTGRGVPHKVDADYIQGSVIPKVIDTEHSLSATLAHHIFMLMFQANTVNVGTLYDYDPYTTPAVSKWATLIGKGFQGSGVHENWEALGAVISRCQIRMMNASNADGGDVTARLSWNAADANLDTADPTSGTDDATPYARTNDCGLTLDAGAGGSLIKFVEATIDIANNATKVPTNNLTAEAHNLGEFAITGSVKVLLSSASTDPAALLYTAFRDKTEVTLKWSWAGGSIGTSNVITLGTFFCWITGEPEEEVQGGVSLATFPFEVRESANGSYQFQVNNGAAFTW
jgi:hypothetical protein